MTTITVHRLSLQFNAGQNTHGSNSQQARQALNLVNAAIEPLNLGAQLIATPDEIEIESSDKNQPE